MLLLWARNIREGAVMNNCKEDNCKNKVDTFYYCDDHFKTEEEGNE